MVFSWKATNAIQKASAEYVITKTTVLLVSATVFGMGTIAKVS
jgi:hypothetical protein